MLYYVSTKPLENGDHEIHSVICKSLPGPDDRVYLGDFADCRAAIAEARKRFSGVNGCKFCSRKCHSR